MIEQTVRIIVHHQQLVPRCLLHQRDAACVRQSPTGRILKRRYRIEEACAAAAAFHHIRQRGRIEALFIHRDRNEARRVDAHCVQGADVGRGLDDDRVAFIDEHLAQKVEALLRTRHHQHLFGSYARAVGGKRVGDPRPQRRVAVGRRILQRRLAFARQHFIERGAYRVDRESRGRRQPAGEGNDFRPLADFFDDIAYRRTRQRLRPRRKLPYR